MKLNPRKDAIHYDLYRLVAAVRRMNSHISVLLNCDDWPEMYDKEAAHERARVVNENANIFQMEILDKYEISPAHLIMFDRDLELIALDEEEGG